MGFGWRYGGGVGLWWLLGLVCLIVIVVGIVWLIAIAFRGPRHAPPPAQPWQPPNGQPQYGPAPYGQPGQPRQTPYEILRERLARGEITVDEYQRTLAALGPEASSGPPGPQGPQPPPSF